MIKHEIFKIDYEWDSEEKKKAELELIKKLDEGYEIINSTSVSRSISLASRGVRDYKYAKGFIVYVLAKDTKNDQ